MVGVPISVHHCKGVQATKVSIWNLANCSCSIEQEKGNTCCSEPDEAAADNKSTFCDVNEFEESCCSYQNEIISWKPDQQMISSFCVVFSEVETELFIISDKLLDSQNISNEKPNEFGFLPPIKLSKVILQHQFIFYA